MLRPLAVLAAVATTAGVAVTSSATGGWAAIPGALRCPLFPRDFAINKRVDRLAVASTRSRRSGDSWSGLL